MLRILSPLLREITRLSFQPSCPLCTRDATYSGLCDSCQVSIPLTGPLCERCGIVVSHSIGQCGLCIEEGESPLLKIRSSLWLTEEAKRLLHLIKFQGRYEWLSLFEKTIAEIPFPASITQTAVLVPTPVHWQRFLKRGFNQADLLCTRLERVSGCKTVLALEKNRNTPPQSTLNQLERRKNLKASISWNPQVAVPHTAILVDDVYTTGETLRACAKVLKKEGVQAIYAWTLFRTPLRY